MAGDGEWVGCPTEDGFRMEAYLARPTGKPRGAVILAENIGGVDDTIREVARRLALEGYLVLAPEIYTRDNLRKRMDPVHLGAAAGMRRAGKSFTHHRYPNAQHAFFDDSRPAHNSEAGADAWGRVKAFPRQNLG